MSKLLHNQRHTETAPRAAVRSDTVVIVRLAELNGGLIKRALDIGADGGGNTLDRVR